GQRPMCRRCQTVRVECTYLLPAQKRGPKFKSTRVTSESTQSVLQPSSEAISAIFLGNTSGTDGRSSIRNILASTDPFSKEYCRGTLNRDLFDAVCAVAARFSDHPAVAKSPPSSNDQVYIDHVKSGMVQIMSEVSLDTVQTLCLLAFAEYCAGNTARGHRLEGIAGRMAPELDLHRFQGPGNKPFESEAARIAFEVKARTFAYLTVNDTMTSVLLGLPSVFDRSMLDDPTPTIDLGWWIERITAWRYCNITALNTQDLRIDTKETSHNVGSFTSTSTAAPTTGTYQQLDFQEEYRNLEMELEQWRTSLSEEWEPSRAKFAISRTDKNVVSSAIYYYVTVTFLNRPFLLKACLSIINRKKIQGELQANQESGANEPELDMDKINKDDNGGAKKQDDELQLLQACLQKYILERSMNKEHQRFGTVEDQLKACHRFLHTLAPYWASAVDQDYLLMRLFQTTQKDDTEGYTVGFDELLSFEPNARSDDDTNNVADTMPSIPRQAGKQQAAAVAGVDKNLPEHAFLTTDSELGTLWGRPDKMAALEKATLLALGKLSMIEQQQQPGTRVYKEK
ncbi:hypothetical protein BGX29_006854, partial [Mortierella sp. GBA35]